MSWALIVVQSADKALKKFPRKDQEYITIALRALTVDPFGGDNHPLGGDFLRRLRTGNYRIKFELLIEKHIIVVYEIKRRTSSSY